MQRDSAKKACYSRNRAAISGWLESSSWLRSTRRPSEGWPDPLSSLLLPRGRARCKDNARRDARRCIVAATMSDGRSSASSRCRFALRAYYIIQTATHDSVAGTATLVNHAFRNPAPKTRERTARAFERAALPPKRTWTPIRRPIRRPLAAWRGHVRCVPASRRLANFASGNVVHKFTSCLSNSWNE